MNPSRVIDLVSGELPGIAVRSMRVRKGTMLSFSYEGLNVPVVVPVIVPDEPEGGEDNMAMDILEVFETGKDLS